MDSAGFARLSDYVVECGGTKELVDGWTARRYKSHMGYYTEEGKIFQSLPAVARHLKLPRALKLEETKLHARIYPKGRVRVRVKGAMDSAGFARLSDYVVECGGTKELVDGWRAERYRSQMKYYTEEGKGGFTSLPAVARHLKLTGVPNIKARIPGALDSAGFAKLSDYVVECGGTKELVDGWRAERYRSQMKYYTEEGKIFKSLPAVARHLKLPRAPKVREKNPRIPEALDSAGFARLSDYVVVCGGTKELVDGWTAERDKRNITIYYTEEGTRFESLPAVARHLKLPRAPNTRKANTTASSSPAEVIEKLSDFLVECGGENNLVKFWSARRDKSTHWLYFSDQGNRFSNRLEVARHFALPYIPQSTTKPTTPDEVLAKLSDYLIDRGMKRELASNALVGWSATKHGKYWRFYSAENKYYKNRTDVKRHLLDPKQNAS
ncbi:hypothetical protein TrRE_jg7156 [Triparma retinervis]|uniref:Uncharacterized protein n=1 Tax=Triparma retinervis TaxID=2557542 RepID=A0A9W7E3C4_9STRA|nr:hypothetical protein TrRE_jg7156 [Triparma retinervis]